MENEMKIVNELVKRGFTKLRGRNTWTKGSWTIRYDKYDVEIFDSPGKTGKYLLENIRTIDIVPILDDIEKLIK